MVVSTLEEKLSQIEAALGALGEAVTPDALEAIRVALLEAALAQHPERHRQVGVDARPAQPLHRDHDLREVER